MLISFSEFYRTSEDPKGVDPDSVIATEEKQLARFVKFGTMNEAYAGGHGVKVVISP